MEYTEMNTLKFKKAVVVVVLALAVLAGQGVIASVTGLDLVPQVSACSGGGGLSGGGAC